MLLAPTIVLLAQALALCRANLFSSHVKPGDDIRSLCARDHVNLTSFTQLERLGELAGGAPGCSKWLRAALPELIRIIDLAKDDLCSASAFDNLRDFYASYLDTSGRKPEADWERLPKSLERFALAYGLQMSNLCKRNMVKELTERDQHLLTDEDFGQLGGLATDGGPVAAVLGGALGSPDEVFMPGDLAPFLKKRKIELRDMGSEKIFIQTATGPYIRRLQSLCLHRFKPIYGPLMVPLVKLANLGFNYKDATLKRDLEDPEVAARLGQWSRIVFLCEALDTIQIVEERADHEEGAEGTDARLVRILTKEEAAAMREDVQVVGEAQHEMETFVYKPNERVKLPDEIYDKNDAKLAKAVRKFATGATEEDVIRDRLCKRGLDLIKSQLKRGHMGVMISAASKGWMRKYVHKKTKSPSERLVRALVDVAERNASPKHGPVSQVIEGQTLLSEGISFLVIPGLIALIIVGFISIFA